MRDLRKRYAHAKENAMRVHRIYHSGFLLETEKSYYLFDYYKGALPALSPEKPIVVFSSHAHQDHFNPEVFRLLRQAGMREVFAVLAKDIPEKKHPASVPVLKVYANKQYTLPHGEPLETLLSTDSGVAYILTTPKGVVYHAGDLNDWTWDGESEQSNRNMRGRYRHEIDLIRGRSFDIAFVPLDPRQEAHYADGMLYFLSTVSAKQVYPMHYWEQTAVVQRFLAEYPQYQDSIVIP